MEENNLYPSFLHFNSIKVRLEPPDAALMAIFLTHFNSIKVRLEQGSLSMPRILLKFQFHKGTIRTASDVKYDDFGRDFNSIKVRLELELSVLECFQLPYFNSIKVRLERAFSPVMGR